MLLTAEARQCWGVHAHRRARNDEVVTDQVAERVKKSRGRIMAERLLPVAHTAGYVGSDRNLRRLGHLVPVSWLRADFPDDPEMWVSAETSTSM